MPSISTVGVHLSENIRSDGDRAPRRLTDRILWSRQGRRYPTEYKGVPTPDGDTRPAGVETGFRGYTLGESQSKRSGLA